MSRGLEKPCGGKIERGLSFGICLDAINGCILHRRPSPRIRDRDREAFSLLYRHDDGCQFSRIHGYNLLLSGSNRNISMNANSRVLGSRRPCCV